MIASTKSKGLSAIRQCLLVSIGMPSAPIEVLTNYVNSSITEDGSGDIDIDYEISLKGLMEGRNTLNITLM